MGGSLIFLIVPVVLALVFFFVLYKSSESWTALHVTLMVLVFLTGLAFVFLAAATLKTHDKWRSSHNRLAVNLAAMETDNERLLRGRVGDVEQEQREQSIRGASAAMNRLLLTRGRVWRNCRPSLPDAGPITVTTVPPDTPPEEVVPHGIAPQMLLYAFTEQTTEGRTVPWHYVGEFQVTEAQEGSVSMRPTMRAMREIVEVWDPDTSWMLYEMLPADSHEVFARMDEQLIRALLSPERLEIAGDQYATVLTQYLRHGQAATDDDPPQQVWTKVRFLRDHQIEVDAEAEPDQANRPERNFDPAGRARTRRLRQGEPTLFRADDTALLDPQTAAQLIGLGICEAGESIYLRPLRDYDNSMHENHRRLLDLNTQSEVITHDTENMRQQTVVIEQRVQLQEGQRANLNDDLQHFQQERDRLEAHLAALDKQYKQVRAELGRLYQQNNRLVTQLTTLHREAARRLGQQPAQAATDRLLPTAP